MHKVDGEQPATEAVQQAFETERPWMSWLNLGEVAYQVQRRHGAAEARLIVRRLRAAAAMDDVTPERVLSEFTDVVYALAMLATDAGIGADDIVRSLAEKKIVAQNRSRA